MSRVSGRVPPGREIRNMFYSIDDFYHIPSSLYAYRGLSLPCGGEGQETDARSDAAY